MTISPGWKHGLLQSWLQCLLKHFVLAVKLHDKMATYFRGVSQVDRMDSIASVHEFRVRVAVATDLAARGLDLASVNLVRVLTENSANVQQPCRHSQVGLVGTLRKILRHRHLWMQVSVGIYSASVLLQVARGQSGRPHRQLQIHVIRGLVTSAPGGQCGPAV